MLKKNITSFKIDLHFVSNQEICSFQSFSSFQNFQNFQQDKQAITPCIILSHNEPQARVKYFTIYDALQFFAQRDYKYPLQIALCAKYSGDRCSDQFIDQYEKIFSAIDSLRGTGKLINIQFILDQSLVPNLKCLENHFLPWNSTLTLHRDPDEAIQSNQGLYRRLQVINPQVGPLYDWIKPLQELNNNYKIPFGKFLQNKYAIQLWEPADEERVAALAQYYQNLKIDHQFMFATNQDPIQKKLYFSRFNNDQRFVKLEFLDVPIDQTQLSQTFSNKSKITDIIKQYQSYFNQSKQSYNLIKNNIQTISQEPFTYKKQNNQICLQLLCYQFPSYFKNQISQVAVSQAQLIALVTISKQVYLASITAQNFIAAKKIDVGTSVSISSNLDNNMTVIIVEDSYCWNSQEFNKNSKHLLCDSKPYSMSGLISYSYGPTQEFNAYIAENQNEQYISSCNEKIMHGTLGTGYNPYVIFQENQPIVIHAGVGDFCWFLEASKCGCSIPLRQGINLLTFPLIYED